MIRCSAQWNGVVLPPRHVTPKRVLCSTILSVVLASCASRALLQVDAVELGAIAASPEEYDGKSVRAEACVSVMVEGMYLLECGTQYPIFTFEADGSKRSNQVFTDLVALGHSMMGERPEKIRVEVQGVYRNSKGRSRFDHTIELSDFRRMRAQDN